MATFSSFDILEAMKIIADSSNSKLKYDKTVEMVITQLTNAATNEYLLTYQGNNIIAYAVNGTIYKEGDKVYVKIPEGDFSNTKVIEGKISSTSQTTTVQEQNILSNTIIEINPSWNEMYSIGELEYGMISGCAQPNYPIPSGQGYEVELWNRASAARVDYADNLFKNYGKEYNKILLKASFSTPFVGTHTKGQYGLKVVLLVRDFDGAGNETTTEVSYILDTSSFVGNPYAYSSYSPQYVVLDLQQDYVIGLKSVSFFQMNMEIDEAKDYRGTTIYTNKDTPNIKVKDIELKFVEIADFSSDNYYIMLDTPQGNMFAADAAEDSTLSLVGKFIYGGQSIISERTCQCKWYIQDPSVAIGTDAYDYIAGPGWKAIEDGVSFNKLTVSKTDFTIDRTYKLIILYGDDEAPYAATATLSQTTTQDLPVIEQQTVGSNVNLRLTNEYEGYWFRELPDCSYIAVGTESVNSITINDYLTYTYVNFYCKVMLGNGDYIVRSFTVYNSKNESDLTVTFDGVDMYQYDANGDITIADSDKERSLEGKARWREGFASGYKLRWLDKNGDAISTNENNKTNPENSMMKDMYVDTNNVLHYKIRAKYNNNYNNNTIFIKVDTVDGRSYDFSKDILFFKAGDPGTNGTTYACVVRPVTAGGALITGFSSYHTDISPYAWFRADVYKDGEKLIDNTIKYKWSIENISDIYSSVDNSAKYKYTDEYGIIHIYDNTTARTDLQTVGIKGIVDSSKAAILKVQVTIGGANIYYNYPIAVSVGSIDDTLAEIDIPTFIQYSASGTNASFVDNDLKFWYNGINKDTNISSVTADLLKIERNYDYVNGEKVWLDTYSLKPTNRFNYDTGTGMLQLKVDDNGNYIMYPIMMYINTYGNEAINGWDGTSIKLDEDNGSILAPQIGAGSKNEKNQFSGIVLGDVQGVTRISGSTNQTTSGLFGFKDGRNTFGLLADSGDAYFGPNKEIYIDASGASITGKYNNSGSVANYMTINLTTDSLTSKAININSGVFYVRYDGYLYASNAKIEGNITVSEGRIGNWNISNGAISLGSTTLSASGGLITTGATLTSCTVSGSITTGNLNATGGKIGGWEITSTGLKNTSGNANLEASNGSYLILGTNSGNYADLILKRGNGDSVFQIYDDGSIIYFKAREKTFLSSSGNNTYIHGNWNITAQAKFA